MRIGKTIYLDHQATTPVDLSVSTVMQPLLSEAFGNPHSSEHSLGWQAAKSLERARTLVAGLIGSDTDEIIFTSGATEANNLALLGYAKRYQGTRRRILVSAIEHKCILVISQVLHEQYGFEVERIPVDQQGIVDLEWLAHNLDNNVLFVSVIAVNNEIGTIQPLEAIGRLTTSVGALLHCDAAQAICAVDIDVESLPIDFLSLSAHKIYGPKGVGALFARRELHSSIEPIIYGGGQENNLRGGTVPVHLCVGMGAAAELCRGPLFKEEREKLKSLRNLFVRKVCALDTSFKLNGPDFENRHPGNANICFNGFVAQDILMALQPKISASTGAACTSGTVEPSYVLRELGLSSEEAEASIRFSLGRFTTEHDVEESVKIIQEALGRL